MEVSQSTLERIFSRVAKTETCWLWEGAKHNGYGQVKVDGQMRQVYRVVYEGIVGPIPVGLQMDHTCHNDDIECRGGKTCTHRACVRPDHLEPVTNRVNVLRGKSVFAEEARRTHCPQGHEYDAENTYRYRNGRRCRACHRDQVKRAKIKLKGN